MAILNNSNAISSGGYDINNSLRTRSSASAYLSRTPSVAGNRRTWTWSAWVKRGRLTTGSIQGLFAGNDASSNIIVTGFRFTSTDALELISFSGGAYTGQIVTTQVFRDPSAWYHLVAVYDTTQATAANRTKIYVNGQQVTAFSTATYPSQNYDSFVNTTGLHVNGAALYSGVIEHFDGYMTDINFIDGQALTPSSFGETDTTTGVWKPKAYTSTYGTNGFYLKFSDIATTSGSNAGLGKDFSGNTNYWTTNNISVTAGTTYDAMIDSPTLTSATVANYATLNPNLRQTGTGQAPTSANLKLTANTTGYSQVCCATIASTSGKFYWEVAVNGGYGTFGIADSNNSAFTSVVCSTSATTSDPNQYTWGWSVSLGNGNKQNNNTATAYGSAASSGDVYMCAVDIDNSKVWFGKNGTWFASGNPAAGTNAAFTNVSGNIIPYFSPTDSGGWTNDVNFGQRPFSYTPPTGFVALNTYNLPDSTIKKGNSYMQALLYTGNGTNNRTVTGVGFNPSLTWVKSRSLANSHVLADSVRGTNANIYSNLTNAETAPASSGGGGIGQVTTDGFTLVQGTVGFDNSNGNGATYVSWNWLAGTSSSSNTSGSITSTVSVNTTAGFSVVTYTATNTTGTIGHGLGVAPKMIIVKDRQDASNWYVYHTSIGATNRLYLNTTAASASDSAAWNNTSPTSTVFSVGTNTNYLTHTHVAYCWAEIAGFSKFGSYTGNGSTDGTFVFTNFRPKFLMVKRTDTTGNWRLIDTTRYTYNTMGNELYPNSSAAEAYNDFYDVLSNGFKMRNTNTDLNASGGTYIYMAFAENPFKNALAR